MRARCVSGLDPPAERGPLLRTQGAAVGLDQAEAWVAISDGGAGLEDFLRTNFPRVDAVILDFFHAAEYLAKLAQALHPGDEIASGERTTAWARLLRDEGGPARIAVREEWDWPSAKGLQAVREHEAWEAWVLYMLSAVEETSRQTLTKVRGIRDLMQETKQRLRSELPKLYSQDLLNNLFRHPYTKIEFIERDLGVSRPTATKYLAALEQSRLLRKTKLGRTNFYINEPLFELLSR